MVTVCWAAKGGSGTTVVAATLALRATRPTLLVDLDGDLPAVLGLAEPDRPGIADWIASDAPAEHLADLLIELDSSTQLLPHRLGTTAEAFPHGHGARLPGALVWLADWEREHDGHVVIDAGTGEPSAAVVAAGRSLLVTRNCYLAVSRAGRAERTPDGVVLIEEPGRSLTVRDIEAAIGAPVVARIDANPVVARAVDAGLLRARVPRVIERALRHAAA